MGYFTFDNSNSGGGGPFNIFRGQMNEDGTPAYEEKKFEDYIVPPAGQFQMMLTGFSEPKEEPIPEMYQKKDGPTSKLETKLEIEITEGQGKGNRFIVSYVTFSLGDRANAFKIYVAALCNGNKDDAPELRSWDDMLNKPWTGYVTNPKLKDDGTPLRAGLSWDTIAPVKEGGVDYNPFIQKTA